MFLSCSFESLCKNALNFWVNNQPSAGDSCKIFDNFYGIFVWLPTSRNC